MITDLNTFKQLLKNVYPEIVEADNGVLNLTLDDINISIASLSENDDYVLFRAKVLDMSTLQRKGEFALAALSGNFFWSGTNGGKLSLGPDNVLYLNERRPLDEFIHVQDIEDCFDEISGAVTDWRVRGDLYA